MNLSVKFKLFLLVLVGVVGMSFISVYDSYKEKEVTFEAKKERVESIIDGVVSQIDALQKSASEGKMTQAQAQTEAKRLVTSFRYDNGNYLWITDFHPKMIMHPLKPALDGKDLSQSKDKVGNLLFVNMATVAKKSGSGYVKYFWSKPNETDPSPKMSYVKSIPEWQWVVGTGIYIDDVNEAFVNNLINSLLVLLALVVISIGIAYLVLISITRPLNKMSQIMQKVSDEGDLSQLIDVDQKDELGKIAQGFNHHILFLSETITEIQRVMGQVAKGNTDVSIEKEMHGVFNELKQNVNQSTRNIDQTIVSLDHTISGLSKGVFEVELVEGLEGRFGSIVDNTQTIVNTLKVSFEEINQVMAEMSAGKFERRIHIEVKGEFETLENNINSSLDSVEKAIKLISESLTRQSLGDYRTKTDAKLPGDLESMEQALNTTCDRIGTTISQIDQSAQHVSSMADEMAQNSQVFSEKMQSQAATLEETSASTEEITATVEQNTDSARQASILANQAQKKAGEGAEITEVAVSAMAEITKSSHQISDIIVLIDSIAFQTNLLALNAAVEAARAGDHGRGFAVVAGEVRNLAQKSADAAKQIKDLIENTVQKIEEGANYVGQSKASLGEINDVILQVSRIIAEITSSSDEQAKAVGHINQAIMSLDKDTQQNSALVETTAQSSQYLNQAAQQMLKELTFFK